MECLKGLMYLPSAFFVIPQKPLVKKLILLLLVFPSLLFAQNGTVRVQRNPNGILPDTMKCGGLWEKAWLTFEIRALSSIINPYEPIHINPRGGNSSHHNNYWYQLGIGAHLVLSNHYAAIPIGRNMSLHFAFVTGADRFGGEGGDSTYADGHWHAFHINSTRIPLDLRMNIGIVNRPHFYLTLTGEAGRDLLFVQYTSTGEDSHTDQKWVNSFSGGIGLHFWGRLWLMHTAITIRSTYMDHGWYRDVGIMFPIFYGKDHHRRESDAVE